MLTKTRVADLRPHDILIPTNRRVTRRPQETLRGLAHQLEVELQYPRTGAKRSFLWNRNTKVTVMR